MNLEELRGIAAAARQKAASFRHCLRVCMAAGCKSSGSDDGEIEAGRTGGRIPRRPGPRQRRRLPGTLLGWPPGQFGNVG